MKKLLILLFSILISFNSYGFFHKTVCVETDAQERGGIIYLPNKTKPFTGKNLCEYSSGQYKSQGKYKDGKKNDVWTEWEKNGQIKFERTYYKGNEIGKDGSVITRNANDQITLEEYFKDGNLVSKTRYSYNRDNGRKSSEEHHKDGSIVYLEYWWDNGHRMSREDWDKISETELQIKKNINNSINIVTDFILSQSSAETNN